MPREGEFDLRQWALILFVVAIGLGLTWSATREAVRSAESEALARFDSAAELYVDRVQNSLATGMNAAGDLYRYYRASKDMKRDEFVRIVGASTSVNEHRRLVAVVIPGKKSNISFFERVASERDGTPFKTYSPELPAGVTASDSELGFYIFYAWAPDADKAAEWTGLDLGAWPAINSFLTEAVEAQAPAAIPLPALGHAIAPTVGNVMVVNPFVSRVGQRGLIIQIIDMPAFARTISESRRLASLNMQIASRWDGGKASASFIVQSGGHLAEGNLPLAHQPIWRSELPLNVGSQPWQVTLWAPVQAFRIDYGAAVITTSVCLILTGLVVFIVWSQSQRAKRVVEIVNRRTRALKEAHEELEDHYKLLQNLNKDVEEARRSAETANRAKSEFLATMSHELRTPLNAILGFSQLLREQALGQLGDSRYVEYANDIHTSGSHLLSLINDILDLAKLEAGKVNIEHKVVHTHTVVERVLTLLAQQAESKGIELKAEIADAMPENIWGDELRIRQILINLASNAIKFTNQGSVVVRLHPKAFQNGAAGWVLEVQDTGIGIPEDKQSTLFDRFTQVDAALSRRHGGVGLGLAICRELVDRMHGKISVRSIPGVGTTIRAHLPLEEASAEDDDDGMLI